MLSYYFDKKIALANGITFSGCTGGMLVLAPLIQYLSDEYTWRGAMMISGGMLGNLCVFSALFRMTKDEVRSMARTRPAAIKSSKSRPEVGHSIKTINGNVDLQSQVSHPKPSVYKKVKRGATSFVKSYTSLLTVRFVMICFVSSFLTGFSHYAYVMYFVSNATNLGIPKTDAAFLLSIFGMCGTIGRWVWGPIIDKKFLSPFDLGGVVLIIGGSVCIFGSLAKSYIQLVILAVVLGLTSGTYMIFYALTFREVVGVTHLKMAWGIGGLLWDASSLVALPLVGK